MKKFILATLLVLSVVCMKADNTAEDYEYPYLTFQTTDGKTKTVSVESLTMTISDGQLIAQNKETDTSFPLTRLSKMFFISKTAGISGISADNGNNDIEVFSLLGLPLGRFRSLTQAQASLARGIYVIKTDSGTQKIAIR